MPEIRAKLSKSAHVGGRRKTGPLEQSRNTVVFVGWKKTLYLSQTIILTSLTQINGTMPQLNR